MSNLPIDGEAGKQPAILLPESAWTKFFIVLGILNLAGALLVLFFFGSGSVYMSVYAGASGLLCFFSAHLVQLLTDCRNYLKAIAEGRQ
jgi:hypothetical protein